VPGGVRVSTGIKNISACGHFALASGQDCGHIAYTNNGNPETTQMTNLTEARLIISGNTYSSAFPGSRPWLAAQAARAELVAFDAAHPEIIAEIRRIAAEKKAQSAPTNHGWI